jgi:hypothetical protein
MADARVASERREMQQRLEAAALERDQLLARVAHEESHNAVVLKVSDASK